MADGSAPPLTDEVVDVQAIATRVPVLIVVVDLEVLVFTGAPANDDATRVPTFDHDSLAWPCLDSTCDVCQDRFAVSMDDLRTKKVRRAR